jgi:hypothetical protein
MGTCQRREETVTEKLRSSKFAGGWSRFYRTERSDFEIISGIWEAVTPLETLLK